MEFIDTHCHPHFDNFLPDVDGVLKSASEAGVKRVIAVGTTLADSQKAIDFAAGRDNVWATAGVHPHEASKFLQNTDAAKQLAKLLNMSSTTIPKNKFSGGPVVAVGEIGLDYYKNYAPKDDQLACLRAQIEIGLPTNLPFIFHVRDAWEDFWRVIDSYPGLHGVVHSFSSDEGQLDAALSRGLYVALNGIMTFTRDEQQLAAAKKVPADKLLLETDAPFLAPKPFRGQTCEPKHIRTIAEFLADLRGEALADLAEKTTANALELFKLDSHGK